MMLYAKGTRIIVNVIKIVLCWGGVLIVMERVISSSTFMNFPKKPTKGVETRFNYF